MWTEAFSRWRALPFFGALACAGCGDGSREGAAAEAYITQDSAGITIVESFAPLWGAGGLQLEPEPFLRIGDEREQAYQFGLIGSGMLLQDGHIVVSESSTMDVRVFDAEGMHVRTFGGLGDGPGEFRIVGPAFPVPGDSLLVPDALLRRSTLFPFAGGAPRVFRHGTEGNFGVFGVLDDGRPMLRFAGSGYRPDLAPGRQWDSTDVVVMDPSDGSPRVVARLPAREQIVMPGGDTRPLAPNHEGLFAAAPDGFYWGATDRYEIVFHGVEGAVRRILRRPVQPVPVEPWMLEEYLEANLERVRQFEGEAGVLVFRRRFEEEWIYGEHVPLFGRAFVDADRRLWISAATWPRSRSAPSAWSVFSEEGVWLGDLEPPAGLRVLHARGDVVLGVWQDELDVPHVQLHRLTSGGPQG